MPQRVAALMERGAFTVSVPSEEHVREADYFGIASGRDEDKFAVTGLTPVRSELVDAPYVAEFPLVLECRIARSVELGLRTMPFAFDPGAAILRGEKMRFADV